jgi:catechol 2,3-dioxygenase-like lactoylglutathione lyase family enzyme
MPEEPTVREMRLVVTATDYAEAVRFYRDVLGLPERAAYSSPDGQVVILEAGRATLEIADPAQAEFVDRVEVGRRVAGHIRLRSKSPIPPRWRDCSARTAPRSWRTPR